MEEMSQESQDSFTQANPNADSRPIYEIGYHIVPTIEEAAVGTAVEKIRAELGKGDAEVISEGFPAKVVLAYTVERASTGKREKYNEAYFGWIKFALDREHIPSFENFLRNDKEILRHLLVETVREDASATPRRAVFSSDRLEGETIKKPAASPEPKAEVSEEELNKSIDALVS